MNNIEATQGFIRDGHFWYTKCTTGIIMGKGDMFTIDDRNVVRRTRKNAPKCYIQTYFKFVFKITRIK